jgi:hypothetical protein
MKEITGFEDYFVTEEGKILTTKVSYRNNPTGGLKELVLSKNKSGYRYANIYAGKGKDNRHSIRIHRIVWQEYKGLIPDGYVVDHINDDKTDNRLSNLQLLTPKQNTKKYWDAKNQTK